MTERELAQIEERAARASSGPWKVEFRRLIGPQIYRDCGDQLQIAYSDDAYFIAHAREDIPRLIAEIQRLRAALAEIEQIKPTDVTAHVMAQAIARDALEGK